LRNSFKNGNAKLFEDEAKQHGQGEAQRRQQYRQQAAAVPPSRENGHTNKRPGDPEPIPEAPRPSWLDDSQSVQDFMEQEFNKIIGHEIIKRQLRQFYKKVQLDAIRNKRYYYVATTVISLLHSCSSTVKSLNCGL
jgi:hypothetical protein